MAATRRSAAGVPGGTITVVQPVDRDGDVKPLTDSTLEATADAIVDEGIATRAQVAEALAGLAAATADSETLIGLPRTFQAWARKRA